jgi:hypothetical protein
VIQRRRSLPYRPTDPAIRCRWWSGYVSLRSLRLAANLGPIRQMDFGWSTTRPFHGYPFGSSATVDGLSFRWVTTCNIVEAKVSPQAGQISSDGEPFDQGDSVNSP